MDHVGDHVGERIRGLRHVFNLTQKAFASTLGISRSHVANLESGKVLPSEQLLLSICEKYELNLEWLKHGKGPSAALEKPLTPKQKRELDDELQKIAYGAIITYTSAFLTAFKPFADAFLVERLKAADRLNPEHCPLFLVDLLEEVLHLREEEPFISVQKMLQKWKPHVSAGKESSADQP